MIQKQTSADCRTFYTRPLFRVRYVSVTIFNHQKVYYIRYNNDLDKIPPPPPILVNVGKVDWGNQSELS